MGEGETASARWVLDNVLASDKALYRGHAVAAVAATDPHVAEDALDLIEVEYEVLEAVTDVQYAMKEEAPVIHESITTEQVFGFFGAEGSEEYGNRPSNIAKRIEFAQGDLEAASPRPTWCSSASSTRRCTTRATSSRTTARAVERGRPDQRLG